MLTRQADRLMLAVSSLPDCSTAICNRVTATIKRKQYNVTIQAYEQPGAGITKNK
jgi:hypothetical protein